MACYMIPNQRTASILKLRTLRLRISRANLTIRCMTDNHIIAGEGTLYAPSPYHAFERLHGVVDQHSQSVSNYTTQTNK